MKRNDSIKKSKLNPFKAILRGKIVLFGIGNVLHGDDGLGPLLMERLNSRVNAVCINAEAAPEKYIGKVVKENPDTLLIIDAVHLGKQPGEYEIVNPESLCQTGFTTHDIPLTMLFNYLKEETNAHIYILGVQPQNVDLGNEPSKSITRTIRMLERMIIEAAGRKR